MCLLYRKKDTLLLHRWFGFFTELEACCMCSGPRVECWLLWWRKDTVKKKFMSSLVHMIAFALKKQKKKKKRGGIPSFATYFSTDSLLQSKSGDVACGETGGVIFLRRRAREEFRWVIVPHSCKLQTKDLELVQFLPTEKKENEMM